MKERQTNVRELAFGGLFTALIALGAFLKITIPLQPMPMHVTLQFFFVLLAAFLLGPRAAALSVGTYLAIGLLGVPVFAAGGGVGYLVRPTFGFLLGFLFAAPVTGRVYELRRQCSFPWLLFSSLCGYVVMYGSGMVYFYVCSNYVLGAAVGWKLVFVNCFLVTAVQDFFLCMLACLVARRLLPVVRNA